ncbi:hypothetical protein HAX54_042862, partial [Datura stramonium]|nr:hypothetical protein [Datura stramonium]
MNNPVQQPQGGQKFRGKQQGAKKITQLILQQTCGQSPGSSHCLGAYDFMFYFTPRWGFFSPFPHGTTSLSVTQM